MSTRDRSSAQSAESVGETLADHWPAEGLYDERRLGARCMDWLLVRPRHVDERPTTPAQDPDSTRMGVCCSGGGVRSAAYNLGALQVLREERVLGDAEYVSAVSGGSYIAASFAAVASWSPPAAGEHPVYGPGSPEEQHLRNHSSYMAPGTGGKAKLLLRVLLGMAVNIALIGVAAFLLARPAGWAYAEGYEQLAAQAERGLLEIKTWMWLIPTVAAGAGVVLALPDLVWRLRWDGLRRFLDAWSVRLIGAGLALAVLLIAVPQIVLWARGAGGASPADIAQIAGIDSDPPSDVAAKGTGLLQVINMGAIVTASLGALRAFVARKRSFFALAAAAVAGPLAVIAPMLWILNDGAVRGFGSEELDWLLGFGVVAALAWLFGDLTQWSLHPFYRRRLCSAFFVERAGQETRELDYEEPLKLSALEHRQAHFPRLLVCAAANVSDQGVTPPGRAATPFVFTSAEIGGPLVGWLKTNDFEDRTSRTAQAITLPAAVAMSGAAVSPTMGKKTIKAMTFLMALTNVRLGVWVPNPRRIEEVDNSRFKRHPTPDAGSASATESPSPPRSRLRRFTSWARLVPGRAARRTARAARGAARSTSQLAVRAGGRVVPRRVKAGVRSVRWVMRAVRLLRELPTWIAEVLTRRRATPLYLFKELFGMTKATDQFLYITDGGHYDNLGLIELLRQGCTTIFCLDAGGDAKGTYKALGEAVALARSELQVDIEIDPAKIVPQKKSGISMTDHVIGRFRYRATPGRPAAGPAVEDEGKEWVGRLVYCRAAVTDDAPWDVKAFHESDKRFPNHSTVDQLFNDEKFESYRALGGHTARRAVERWRKQILRETVERILQETARRGDCIRYATLVARVRAQTRKAVLPTLRPFLDEIASSEKEAKRPPLCEVVQEEPPNAEILARLRLVWEYWEPAREVAG